MNEVLYRPLNDTIHITYRNAFHSDGSSPNLSVLESTRGTMGYDWRGPVLAYGRVGLSPDPPACRDLDPNDFQHLADYFTSHGNEFTLISQRYQRSKVVGAKVNCLGDQKICHAPPFEAVEVPLSHPIFHDHSTSGIAARIGLPIMTRKYPPNRAWADKNESIGRQSAFNNSAATFLHVNCDKDSKDFWGWGWAPWKWQMPPGSVLIVRQDRKPLLPLHAEALCRYCEYGIAPLFRHSMGEYAPEEEISKDDVLAFISRLTFAVHWQKVLQEKLKEGGELVKSPYED